MKISEMEQLCEQARNWLEIDKHALDEALEEQAQVYHRIAEACSYARSQRDEAYDNIKRAEADLNLRVREELENEGIKVTEKNVEARVQTHEERKAAVDKHLQLAHICDRLYALRDSFNMRAYMIRSLVELHVSGYFMENARGVAQHTEKQSRYDDKRARMAQARKRPRPKDEGE